MSPSIVVPQGKPLSVSQIIFVWSMKLVPGIELDIFYRNQPLEPIARGICRGTPQGPMHRGRNFWENYRIIEVLELL